ncbi:hypothetical protein ABZ682_18980 [Streptomyces griseoviridis]|uniref:hypothetical protein n=1 Tax=Streptomyces griseoviridis TaxID=45398 RepID=UPI0033F5B2FC
MTSNTQVALANYISARRALVDALVEDRRGGTSANALATMVGAAWSRPVTLDYLRSRAVAIKAREALKAAGLSDYVEVRTTGDLSGPRQALLQLSCDHADRESPARQDLPGRITGALRAAGIGWTADGTEGPSLDVLLDEVEHVELFDPKTDLPGYTAHNRDDGDKSGIYYDGGLYGPGGGPDAEAAQ